MSMHARVALAACLACGRCRRRGAGTSRRIGSARPNARCAQPAQPDGTSPRRSSSSAAVSSSSARPRPPAKAPSAAPICSCGRCCASPSCSRPCPGMVAVQHSGSGKANQYFLRGFNLDHGTDFTTYVDGVPLEPPLARPRPGLSRRQRLDARDRRAHRLPQGPVSRRRRRLRDGRRRRSSRRSTGSTRRSSRSKAARTAGSGSRRGGTKELDDGATLTGLVERKTLRRPVGAERRTSSTRRCGANIGGRRISARWPSRSRATTATGIRPSRFPSARSARAVCEDAFCALDPTATGRYVALDRRRAARRRRVARLGLCAVLRLVHVRRTRPTTSRSTSSTAVGRRAAATTAPCSRPTK